MTDQRAENSACVFAGWRFPDCTGDRFWLLKLFINEKQDKF
jgi:hypothetical protein